MVASGGAAVEANDPMIAGLDRGRLGAAALPEFRPVLGSIHFAGVRLKDWRLIRGIGALVTRSPGVAWLILDKIAKPLSIGETDRYSPAIRV